MIRATFELEPPGSAEALAEVASTGMAAGPVGPGDRAGPVGPGDRAGPAGPGDRMGPDFARARVVAEGNGRAVLDFPVGNWGAAPAFLVSALVAGEASETGAFTRCRLVGLEVPDGLLPGPAFGAGPGVRVGVIVKPSLGLSPAGVADVVAAATGAGATFVKDDELLGDPEWCPLPDRVRAVAAVLPAGVVYCANVTGPLATLLDRARRAVDLGATGVLVNAVAQGLDSVLALRQAGLGVPILVHRAGSGPWCRNDRFGATGAVLTRLFRLCGADHVIVGAFGGKLFDTEAEVRANLSAARERLGSARPAWALLGGGIGPDNAAGQVEAAGGEGLVLLLGSRAYGHPGGIAGGVRRVVESLS